MRQAALATPTNAGAQTAAASMALKCRLCTCALNEDDGDDLEHRICGACKDRPEARRLGIGLAPLSPRRPHTVPKPGTAAREFTAAEKSLVSKVHGFMPALQLLDLLNERLVCDLGPEATRYTMEQLQAEIAKFGASGPGAGGSHDWASLRKLLAQARRSGLLSKINEGVINDFAVVFSLNPKQVIALKDILLQQPEAN